LLPYLGFCRERRELTEERKAKFYRETGEYHYERQPTPLLDTINYPIHIKNLFNKVK